MKPRLLFRGPTFTASGYGVHARQLLRALLVADEFDVHLQSIKWGETPHIVDDADFAQRMMFLEKHREQAGKDCKYEVSIQVTIPNEFEKIARFNVGVTAGIEVDIPSPQWLLKCNTMDLVIVPSHFSRDVIAGAAFQGSDGSVLRLSKPIAAVPEGVDTRHFNTTSVQDLPEMERIDTDFNFLHVGLGFDKPFGEDRKNITSLVKWFCERFKGDRETGLVLKSSIINGSLLDFSTLKAKIGEIKQRLGCSEFPRIYLLHGRLDDASMARVYKHSKVKAFVSLTHGEGFGLPLIEAAACGLPVVATNWSGHLDFLHKDGKRLFVPIEADLGQVPDSAVWPGVIEKQARWAFPKEDDFKHKALKLVKSYDKPKEWANELAAHIAHRYSLEATGKHFSDLIKQFYTQLSENTADTRESAISLLKKRFSAPVKKLLYTMPMSAGDVYISTAVVDSLRKKFPDHRIYFATQQRYRSILDGNSDVDEVIEWENWMQDVPLLEQVFDEVYTPNLTVQMTYSNWVHGGKGRNLAEELANACLVELGSKKLQLKTGFLPIPLKRKTYITFHPGSGKDQWSARNYRSWQDVVSNLVAQRPDLKVVQIGTIDEPLYRDVVDLRGKTKDYGELATIIEGAAVHVGIDSVSMHIADGVNTPFVALFGSSYPNSTGPAKKSPLPLRTLLETTDRFSCEKACYKTECFVDKEFPCINNIQAMHVAACALGMLPDQKIEPFSVVPFKEFGAKISGYTHVLNAKSQSYPYIQSIKSMLGFCDEVLVVDGGSDDGTRESLDELAKDNPSLKIMKREWDWNEPAMDGMQKAFARAMCSGDFLWQQDADEVVHEEDYAKIKSLVKRFPSDAKLVHLPVIELWGDDKSVRTDRHAWKWRISRNDFSITHGIVKHARLVDDKTGKTYAKKGQSDGCEYIDIMTGEYVPHRGFYNQELENIRRNDPHSYGDKMNEIFNELPSVYHYSWADLPRKIVNFKRFWNRCWSNLYKDSAPEDRFPDVDLDDPKSIEKKANELLSRGGEHGEAATFKLARSAPAVMR